MTDRKEYYKAYNAERKEQKKQYNAERYKLNKDEILAQQKKYRDENTDRIKEHKHEKVICDVCGCSVSRHHLTRHKKTIKCINYENKN